MKPRDTQDNTPPDHNDFWKHTDKKTTSTEHYFWKKEAAEKPMGKVASTAAVNAKGAALATLPVITGMGISIMTSNIGGFSLAPLGLPFAIGGVVLDVVKAPVW